MIRLISFLGNPGKNYELTRHNLPWLLADRLGESVSLTWKSKFGGTYSRIGHGGASVYLHKPLQFMNKSGRSVSEMLSFYKLTCKELLVVHDDVELEPGTFAFKFDGGLSGHNGLRSIVSSIGTKDFYRLRIGAGRPARGNVSSYVLKRLSSSELALYRSLFEEAAESIQKLMRGECSIDDFIIHKV
jgi:PTH1 family peptidyl-tRNA hydrolase